MAKAAATARKRKGTGARWAHDAIREQILNLQLGPGQNLDEAHFVRALGVSRTPVREALIQLAAEGLVDLLPNRGARVSLVDLSGVREFFEALDVSQRVASRWAAIRRSDADLEIIDGYRLAFEEASARQDVRGMMDTNLRFHAAIGDACGNAIVARQYAHLLTLGLRLSRLALVYEGPDPNNRRPGHIAEIIQEHRALLGCVTEGHADAAEDLARQHTELFRRHINDYLAQSLSSDIALDLSFQSD